jgi:sigma-B regulation protein RsbU (phosphoserine phosphatase)
MPMFKNRGIAFKLILLIMASITLILSSVFFFNYSFSRRIITANVEKNARNLALATVNRIDSVLLAVQKVPSSQAQFLESFSYEGGDLLRSTGRPLPLNPMPTAPTAEPLHHTFTRKTGTLDSPISPTSISHGTGTRFPRN